MTEPEYGKSIAIATIKQLPSPATCAHYKSIGTIIRHVCITIPYTWSKFNRYYVGAHLPLLLVVKVLFHNITYLKINVSLEIFTQIFLPNVKFDVNYLVDIYLNHDSYHAKRYFGAFGY